jgi:hypothetical protein
VERFVRQYAEEFVGYDGYITSQRNIKTGIAPLIKMQYLPSFNIPHPLLEPDYGYDVLYIYETYDPSYIEFLNHQIKNAKIYGSAAFANLTEQKRREELAKAKLVVYTVDQTSKDDSDFVPFAVYDIISYGRPLLTDFKPALDYNFNNLVFLLNNPNNLKNETLKTLQIPDYIREQHARKARDILHAKDLVIPDFFNQR